MDTPILQLLSENGNVEASWTPVDGATAYDLVLSDSNGLVVAQLSATQPHLTIPVDGTQILLGATYAGRVRGRDQNSVGRFSNPVNVTTGGDPLPGDEADTASPSAPPPEADAAAAPASGAEADMASTAAAAGSVTLGRPLLQVTYESGAVQALWSAVSGATSYEFELSDAAGTRVASLTATLSEMPIIIDAATSHLAQGQTYTGRIRARAGDAVGLWSFAQSVQVFDLAAPALAVTYEAGVLYGRWPDVAGAQAYDFELRAADNVSVVVQEQVAPSARPATVNSGLEAGQTYHAYARAWVGNVVGPLSADQTVTIINLDTPTWDGSNYQNGALQVSWHAVGSATRYEFELWDTSATPSRISQQTINSPATQATVGEGLTDGQTYTARVRASVGNVYSAWAQESVLADPLPLMLRQLRDRLRQAYAANSQQQLVLDQTTIGTDYPDIIKLFTDNFGSSQLVVKDLVPRDGQAIWQTNSSVNVVGTAAAALLGIDGMGLAATFEAPADTLRLTLKITPPAGWRFAQSFPHLTGTVFDQLTLDAPTFYLSSDSHVEPEHNVTLSEGLNFYARLTLSGSLLTYATQLVAQIPQPMTLTGHVSPLAPQIEIHLRASFPDVSLTISSLPLVALAAPQLCFDSVYLSEQAYSLETATVEGSAALGGSTVPVAVGLPVGMTNWLLTLRRGESTPLTSLTGFLGIVTSEDLVSTLPPDVRVLTGFQIYEFNVEFDAPGGSFYLFQLGVSATGIDPQTGRPQALWKIIEGLLELSMLDIELTVRHYTGADGRLDPAESSIVGAITGSFRVGNSLDLVGSVVLPIGAGNWTLQALTNINLNNLTDFSALLGGSQLSTLMPGSLGSLPGYALGSLEIEYNPSTGTLNSLTFGLASDSAWTIVSERLVVTDMNIEFRVQLPMSQRIVTGMVSGTVEIGSLGVSVNVSKPEADSDWTLEFGTYPVVLPSLGEMTTFLGGEQLVTYLPASIANGRFVLNYLDVDANLTTPAITYISLQLVSHDIWVLITEEQLSVRDILFSLSLDWSTGTLATEVYVEGVLMLASVGLEVSAQKSGATWTVGAELVDPLTIDLVQMNAQLLPAGVSLPYEYGFPRGMNLNTAALVVVLPDDDVQLNASSTFDWQFSFGQRTDLKIQALAVDLHILKKLDDGTLPYTFKVGGLFQFATINATLIFTTGNTAQADTILTATLTDASSVSLTSVADNLVHTTPTNPTTWVALEPTIPASFTGFGASSLSLVINLSQNTFILFGSSTNFGYLAFLTKKLPDATWGYFVAVKLADNFTFASIVPELGVVDGILTVRAASFAISSFTADSVQALTAPVPQFAQALTLGSGSAPAPVGAGLNFYAALDFTSTLFGNIVKVLKDVNSRPDLVVYAYIDANATNTVFRATLGDFQIVGLDVLTFSAVSLQYRPNANSELKLGGDMRLALSGTIYTFHGELTITNTSGHFALTALAAGAADSRTGQIQNPLGMTGVVIENLSLVVDYTFPAGVAATLTLQVTGTVSFHTTPPFGFSTTLYFINGTPVLVDIRLTQPLSIISFFAQCVGTTWPPDFFDIKLLTGSVYYYDKASDPTGVYDKITLADNTQIGRVAGFNIQTTFEICGYQASLAVNVQAGGVVATGKLLEAFDLGFIRFSDKDFTGSPSVALRVLSGEQSFGFACGFSLFGERFARGELAVGKFGDGATSEAELRGTLSYEGSVREFVGTSITFTYSETEGFKVSKWPFGLDQLLDFERYMNGFQKGGCGALVGMVFDKAVKTNFALNPTLSTTADNIVITLRGRYTVTLVGASSPFLEVSMPDLRLSIRKADNLTLSSLPGRIAQFLVDNTASLVAQILNDPAKFSLFIATVGLVNAAPSLTADLICNGGQGAAESAQAVQAAEAAAQAAETAAAAGDVAAAEAAAAAAAAAAAGEGGGAAAAAAATAAAAAVLTAIINAGGSSGQTNPSLDKPHLTGVTYVSGSNQVKVTWGQVNHAEVYRVDLLRGSSVVATQNLSSNNLEANFDAGNLTSGTYNVQVTAAAANYQSSTSDRSSIVKLERASIHALTYSGNHLNASWESVGGAPAGYAVELSKDGQRISTTETNATSATFDTQGVGSYTFRVRAKGDASHITGDWSEQSNAVRQLAEPSISALSYANGKIHVVLTSAVSGASGYSLQLLHDTTPTGSAVRLNGANQLTADIDATNLAAGTYRVEAMANAPDDRTVPSGWSVSTDVITKLATPTIGSLSYANGYVTVALSSSVSGTSGYDVRMVNSTGQAVGYVTRVAPNATSANVPIAGLPPGVLRAGVVANAPDNKTIPGDAAISTETVERLERVAITSVILADASVTINWSAAVAGATEYVAQLLDANNTPVGTPMGVGADALTATVPVEGLPVGTYRAAVISASSAPRVIPSEWSVATAPLIRVLPAPTALSLVYEGDFLRATWQAVEGATYRFQLHDANNVLVNDAQTAVTHVETQIAAVILESGMSYTARVRAQATDGISDWSTAQLLILPKPVIQSLEYTTDDTLRVVWQAVAGASGFAVRVLNQSGNPLPTQPTISVEGNAANITGAGVNPDTILQVQVRVSTASAQSDWSTAVATPFRPVVKTVENTAANVLFVSWQPVTNAASYEVQIQTATGTPLSPAPTIDITGTSADISGAAINTMTVYSVRVRARSTLSASAWSAAVASLSVPTVNETSIVNNHPVFSWLPMASATGYEVQVLDGDTGMPLRPQPTSNISGTQATFTGEGLVPGVTYKVRVRALSQQAKSAWSTSLNMYVPPAPPTFEFSHLDAVSWYDTQSHLRVYSNKDSRIIERGYDGAWAWFEGLFSAAGITVGSTSWLSGEQIFLRVYVRDADSKITEYCWDKNKWYVGAFRADGTGAAPACWLAGAQSHLRVYVGDSAGKITEYCWDKDRWYVGAFKADGVVVDSTAWMDTAGQSHLRTYVIEASGQIKEYCWDKASWYVGAFNAVGTSVSATSWVDSAGQAHLRVYVRDADSKITEYCWDKDRWYVGAFAANGISASATSWLAAGQARIRVYVRGADGKITEYCWDKDRWYIGEYRT